MKSFDLNTTILLLFVTLNAYVIKAQCTSTQNSYSCQVTIDVLLFDNPPLCLNQCDALTGIVINPTNSVSIPCGLCSSGACNIQVSIVAIAGIAVGPYTTDYNSGAVGITGPGTCPTGSLFYDSNAGIFKVQ